MNLGYAHIDHHRNLRNGFQSDLLQGKVMTYFGYYRMNKKNTNILGTDAEKETFDKISKIYIKCRIWRSIWNIKIKNEEIKRTRKGKILIITGGTSDTCGRWGILYC